MFNRIHAKPISTVDQRGSPLGPFHKISKKVWLRVIQAFNTSFRDNAAAIRLVVVELARVESTTTRSLIIENFY